MVRHDASIARWLHLSVTDAEARGLPELKGLLEALAESTRALRSAEMGTAVILVPAGSPSATNVSSAAPKGDERVDPASPGRGNADNR
jgi:hypothetical protein